MRRPSFQFYPADWAGNTNLRRCTHAEKGVWVDILCLMHDNKHEYGVLRWPLAEISQAVGCELKVLRSLAAKEVLKGSDEQVHEFVYVPRTGGKDGDPVTLIEKQAGPLWYSSRMVRDEYIRQHRGGATRFRKAKPKAAPKPPFGDGSSSSSSSASAIGSMKRCRSNRSTGFGNGGITDILSRSAFAPHGEE